MSIISLQWSNKWEPNIFNEQYTPSCLYQHTRRLWVQDLEWICPLYLHFLSMARAKAWFISFTYDFHESGVSSSLGHGVPAAENISLRHANSIFLSKTKVYGYRMTPHYWDLSPHSSIYKVRVGGYRLSFWFLNPEDGNDRLYRNVGKKLTLLAA